MKKLSSDWLRGALATSLCVAIGCSSPPKKVEEPAADKAAEPAAESAADKAVDLPKGEAILDRYVEVTGGRAAYEKVTSRVAEGKFSMPKMNISGPLKSYQKAPSFFYVGIDLPGAGKIEGGYDGETAWENVQMTGPRILEGDELFGRVREARMDVDVNWRDLYTSAETVALEEVNGKPAYKVIVTPKNGPVETRFYDQESGLFVRLKIRPKTQMGEIDMVATASDYREVDGIKIPFQTTVAFAGQEIVTTTDKVEHNVEIPAETFALPDDIKKLLEQRKGAK
jgi:hypothetical protein